MSESSLDKTDMARSTKITDEQILAAAREVFLQHGYSASTASIARTANVSEGTLFKRYATKEQLFFAALEIDTNPKWHRTAMKLSEEWRGREGLVDLLLEIYQFFQEGFPKMVTVMGSGIAPKQLFSGLENHPKNRDIEHLVTLIGRQIEAGNLRPVDPTSAAEFLLGTVLFQVLEASETPQAFVLTKLRQMAENMVDLIWFGIGAPSALVD